MSPLGENAFFKNQSGKVGKDMLEAADNLEFERAAYLRDIISAKKKEMK